MLDGWSVKTFITPPLMPPLAKSSIPEHGILSIPFGQFYRRTSICGDLFIRFYAECPSRASLSPKSSTQILCQFIIGRISLAYSMAETDHTYLLDYDSLPLLYPNFWDPLDMDMNAESPQPTELPVGPPIPVPTHPAYSSPLNMDMTPESPQPIELPVNHPVPIPTHLGYSSSHNMDINAESLQPVEFPVDRPVPVPTHPVYTPSPRVKQRCEVGFMCQ
jgi:hypothetical protein